MINLYRPARYPDRDTFLVQAEDKDLHEFRSKFFPIRAEPTKKEGFEREHYIFLRYENRELFESIRSFFRENFSAPSIQVSVFRSTHELSTTWKANVWEGKVTDAIKSVFQRQGYGVQDNVYSKMVEVLPAQATFQADEISVFWGCQFWVQVNKDCFVDLWASGNFWFYIDDQPTNFMKIAQKLGDASETIQKIQNFTRRSSEEQFTFLERFISHIGALQACEGIQFRSSPLTANELNMDTWFWLHDSAAAFCGAGDYPSTFTQSLLEPGGGFYHQPDDLGVLVLLPEVGTSSIIPSINWDTDVAEASHTFITRSMSKVSIPFDVIRYPVAGALDGVLDAVRAFVNQHASRRVFCLLPTPGADARRSTNEQIVAASQQTHNLERELRNIFIKGFTETLDWNNLADPKARQFILENAIMTGLYRFGALPWRLTGLSFDGEPADNSYFLGVAGSPESGAIAGVVIDSSAKLIAFAGEYPEGKNVDFPDRVLGLITDIISGGFHHTLPKPLHLIVHLSSELSPLAGQIQKKLEQAKLACDVVSIHPDSSVRFLQTNNKEGTPSNGIAIGDSSKGIAYLMNTLAVAEKTSRGYIYPSPAPLMLRVWGGNTSLKTLASHVYWLSAAHINALHRTVDLPITIAYAQALQKHIAKTRRSMRVTKNHNRTLFWL